MPNPISEQQPINGTASRLETLRQLRLFTEITQALSSDFARSVSAAQKRQETFELRQK